MKILILGASNSQINAILKAKQKGHTVVVSDYYEDSPGKAFCDYKEITSTFDAEGNIEVASRYGVDGVMTMGTDQPILTAARVAEKLNLPSFIDTATARAVTNKKVMKKLFTKSSIPTAEYRIIREDFALEDLLGMRFPIVVKPLDSQGQRGVYKLTSINDIRRVFKDVLSFSREEEILVEEYYDSLEVTISGWVLDDEVYILTVTDRVTYDNLPHIGICTAHNFPSRHYKSCFDEISHITKRIVECFKIHNGPIYFQMLIGREGIKVNEVACRIGGAYEDEFIPLLTGVDILDMVIDYSLGIDVDYTSLKNYDICKNNKTASVQMIFIKPGLVESIGDMDEIKKLPGVIQGKFNIKAGQRIGKIINATQRAGYMIIEGGDENILKENIGRAFRKLRIFDEQGNNMIIKF